ncbi:MAG TPA: hypothetical protein VFC79_02790, partial [Tissierellaceae bacterium]|nr:hypothetical protein [Tissierellaceae bacterium]
MAKIGLELMPMFQKMMDWVMQHMPEIQAVIKTAFEYIGIFVTTAADIFGKYLLPIFQSIFDWTKTNWPTIQKIIEGVFNAIKFVWDKVLGPVLKYLWDALKLVVDFVANNFDGMQRIVEGVFDGIGKAVKVVTGIFEGVTGAIKTAYDWLTSWNKTDVKDKTPSTSESARSYVTKPAKNAKGTENFGGGWSWVGEQGPELMKLPSGTKIRSNPKSMEMANSTVNHTGTITVKGVNNNNELQGVVDIVMDQLRREVRMA